MKMQKQGSQIPKPIIEPRVIADEFMDDGGDDMIFEKEADLQKNSSSFDPNNEAESTNVFTRLSQLGNKSKGAALNTSTSLNVS